MRDKTPVEQIGRKIRVLRGKEGKNLNVKRKWGDFDIEIQRSPKLEKQNRNKRRKSERKK